jgi:PDZ domain-containing protein
VDTINPMVVGPQEPPGAGGPDAPDSPLAWSAPPPQASRRWLVFLAAGFVVVALFVASTTVRIPYYALAPGSARQVNDLIDPPADKHFPPKGHVLMVTVALGPAHPWDVAQSWFNHDIEILKEKEVVGTTPPQQYRRQNLQQMDESKRTAVVVALRRLGYEVPARGQGALISGVVAGRGLPAEGHLKVGEVITEIDGQPVKFVEDAVARLREHKPGDTVRLRVLSADDDTNRIEQLVLGRNDDGVAVLGVELQTYKLEYDLPFDVGIDSGSVGGPSAGLAFTLAVLDELTPGELTGGKNVAVTGTIEIDGTVGDVGGVAQKTAAAIAAGAKYFLVPPNEFNDAKKRAGSRLKVVRVASLDQALDEMRRLGGDVNALGPRPAGAPG